MLIPSSTFLLRKSKELASNAGGTAFLLLADFHYNLHSE